MKKIFIFLYLVSIGFVLRAQNHNDVNLLEFEVGVGINQGLNIDGGKATTGLQFFIEPRLNIANTAFDVGFQLMLATFARDLNNYGIEHDVVHKGMMTTFLDYNFRYWRMVSIFAGCGVGFSPVNFESMWYDEMSKLQKDKSKTRSVVVNPRIGVEIYNHLRITAEYKIMKKEYSFFGFNIGFAFGGGYK